MRAVIIATGCCDPAQQFSRRHRPELLPLLDRPFLQHVIEYIAGMGIRDFDIILSEEPEAYTTLLGDGSRWGCRFTIRLARSAERPYAMLHALLGQQAPGPVLLAHAATLPSIDARIREAEGSVLVCAPDGGGWTGWAAAGADDLATVPADADRGALERHLAGRGAAKINAAGLLSVSSYADLIAAQRRVLSGDFQGLLFGGQKAAEGVWLSRNVSLHPSARLNPPVYICADCRIGSGATLGPNAVVGSGCILDSRCSIADSAVLAGSYVGEMLELKDCVVDRNLLVNTRIGGEVLISDAFILGAAAGRGPGRLLARALSRLGGAVLLGLLWPLLLAVMLGLKLFRKGPVLFWHEAVRLPAGDDPLQWVSFRYVTLEEGAMESNRCPGLRHLLLQVLPGLAQVARGTMSLAGVMPRSAAELQALPRDWRALCCSARPGLISEAMIAYGFSPTPDELYSAEAYYSVSAGFRHDARLCASYFARLLRGPCGAMERRRAHVHHA